MEYPFDRMSDRVAARPLTRANIDQTAPGTQIAVGNTNRLGLWVAIATLSDAIAGQSMLTLGVLRGGSLKPIATVAGESPCVYLSRADYGELLCEPIYAIAVSTNAVDTATGELYLKN